MLLGVIPNRVSYTKKDMIEIEHILVLIGVVLVLFFAVLMLTSKKYKSRANNFLALAIIMLAVLILKIEGILAGTLLDELFDIVRIEYAFAFVLYLYVTKALNSTIRRTTYLFLVLPFVLFSSLYAFALLTDRFNIEAPSTFMEKVEPFEIYLILGFNLLVISLFTIKVQRSDSSKSFKNWIYIISIGLSLVLGTFFLLEVMELFFDRYDEVYWRSAIALFFVLLTYYGVQQLQVERELVQIKKIVQKNRSPQKSKRTTLPQHYERMELYMQEEAPYKDIAFDREAMASKLGLSASSITRILKTEGQSNFNDYINKYRIKLAKQMLTDPRFDIFSLEAIGREVGFRSRSSFYQSFKKEVGVSPGVFKKK